MCVLFLEKNAGDGFELYIWSSGAENYVLFRGLVLVNGIQNLWVPMFRMAID